MVYKRPSVYDPTIAFVVELVQQSRHQTNGFFSQNTNTRLLVAELIVRCDALCEYVRCLQGSKTTFAKYEKNVRTKCCSSHSTPFLVICPIPLL
jgi:hypothetical protein